MYFSLLYTGLLQRLEENLVGTMEALVSKYPVYYTPHLTFLSVPWRKCQSSLSKIIDDTKCREAGQ